MPAPPVALKALAQSLDTEFDLSTTKGVIVGTLDEAMAVVAFHNFNKTEIEVSMRVFSARGGTPRVIGEILSYAFHHPSVRRLVGRTHRENAACQRLMRRLGFKEEGVLRQAAPDGGDLLLFSLLRDEYEQSQAARNP